MATRVRALTPCGVLALALLPGPLPAQDVPPASEPARIGLLAGLHSGTSRGVTGTAEWLDSFFIDDRIEVEDNRSHLLLRNDNLWREGETGAHTLDIRARLRLPALEERLELAITGADEDETGLPADGTATTESEEDEAGITDLTLRFVQDVSKRMNLRYESGARFQGVGVQAFVGVRYRQNIPMPGAWAGRFIERWRWYTDSGWESRGRLQVDRQLAPGYLGRFQVTADADQPREGWFYSAGPRLFQELSSNRVIRYEIQGYWAMAEEASHRRTVARLHYRQRLWQNWVFAELTPAVSWPQEEGFEPTPQLLLRLDAYFSERHAEPQARLRQSPSRTPEMAAFTASPAPGP
ncbi:hypothetical protein [Thiohalospira halophila]|uniref:hypothetical protein n=1 Tax=Thiohalospira halophila TaxID=381300 RepID=UPI001180838E|nr:hypothetical protein [Thiohalospira halophila]